MNGNLIWILILVTKCAYVASRPADTEHGIPDNDHHYDAPINHNNEQVISVRITSSVAVGRGKKHYRFNENDNSKHTKTEEYNDEDNLRSPPPNFAGANIEFIKQLNAKKELKEQDYLQKDQYERPESPGITRELNYNENNEKYQNTRINKESNKIITEDTTTLIETTTFVTTPALLHESNEFDSSLILDDALKLSEKRLNPNTADQTNTDKSRSTEFVTSFTVEDLSRTEGILDIIHNDNETDDSIAESSIKTVLEIDNKNENNYENVDNVPLARSLLQSPSSKNYIQGFTNKPPSEREHNTRLTTVSFNVVHDLPSSPTIYNDPNLSPINPSQTYNEQQKLFETQKLYSQPAQIYSEPAKFYSEPAKIYSEPAKIYSEPAKFYSEPAKIYSEPAKFYSEPASLHLGPNGDQNYMPWQQQSHSPTTTHNTTPLTTITYPGVTNTQPIPEHQPEKNYEIDEKVSVLTDGRSHGIQETSTEKCKQDNCKVGYVVKGREYNKYRVEERTSDGFIVGEYGVVRNEDGALRGVRYTADSEASPRLIYDALMKFLQLK